MRKRWTGLATTVALVASLLALNGAVGPARAEAPGDETWTVFAAGDVAKCTTGHDELTAAVIKNGITDPAHTKVLMLGDGAYADGSLATYNDCYDKTASTNDGWGQFKDITLPVPGNHDYGTVMSSSDSGYRDYWAGTLQALEAAGGQTMADNTGWYSTEIGNWHVIGLNWACGDPTKGGSGSSCAADGPQAQWLSADLAKAKANNKHVLAMWHGARFFTGNDNGTPTKATDDAASSSDAFKTNAYWKMLQDAGADVVLAGHQHFYERFGHMSVVQPAGAPAGDHQGQVDPAGPREFVVGTGGGEHHAFNTAPAVGSEARIDNQFGVLKLTLRANDYDWQFIASGSPGEQAAGTVLDSGHDTTHATFSGTGSPDGTPDGTPGGTIPGGTTPGTNNGGNRKGYWMVGSDGKVYAFGQARNLGDAGLLPGTVAVDLEPTPSGDGYWVVDDAGGVSSLGDAVYHGAPDSMTLRPGEKVTSLASTRTGKGYWMFTDRGRVLSYGDAVAYGDLANTKLNAPVLDSIVTPSGKGYYMVGADGGIFTFGDAKFYGSTGNIKLNKPVQSLVPDSDGVGYWLVASDGGIFSFDAPFKGSLGSVKLNKPVTGMVRYADGYLMVGEDGGIFNFSHQDFLGSLGANPPAHPIVSVAALG